MFPLSIFCLVYFVYVLCTLVRLYHLLIHSLTYIYIYIYIGSKKHGVDSLMERVESISFDGKILNSRVLKCLI